MGIVICTLFVLWATVTGPLGADLAVNVTLHPITIGIFSNTSRAVCSEGTVRSWRR